MNLKNTELLLKSLKSDGELDTYAISVQCGGQMAHLFSDCADTDTLFDVASMGKILVTAPLILRLAGEGVIALEDPLTRFFPDVPPDKAAITVRQLLTHTSGIVRIEFPPEIADADLDAVDACILRVPLAFRPGTDYRYSCNGYILLGHILERVTGRPLDRLFRETLFQPLGLTRTCFAPAVDTPNLAVCCEREQVGSTPVDDANVRKLHGVAGSGANFWTVRDIEAFTQAVWDRSPALYAPSLFAQAEQDATPHFVQGQGLGYEIVDHRFPQTGRLFPAGSFGHTGHTGQSLFLCRENKLAVLLLTNATRCQNRRSGWRGYDYGRVMEIRRLLHNAIADDLAKANLL